MGARYQVDQIALNFYASDPTYIASAYSVAVSGDPTFGTYTTLETVSGNSSQTRTDTIATPGTGRYIRVTFTQCASNTAPFYCPTLSKIKVWGTWSRDTLPVSSATAINYYGTYQPIQAFDGNPSTFWQANSTQTSFPKWLQADLGSQEMVAGVNLNFYTGATPYSDYYATDIALQVSNDPTFGTYSLAAHLTSSHQSSLSLSFAPLAGRYVRFVFNDCADSSTKPFDCPTVTEATIYGQSPSALTGGTALPVAAAYASNYYAGDPTQGEVQAYPANAFDGNSSTYWHGNDNAGATGLSNPKWLIGDLGAENAISQVVVTYYDASTHLGVNFQIQVSDDPTFTSYDVFAQVVGNSSQTITATANPVVGRYVRLLVTAAATSDWFSPAVTDISITGVRDEGIPQPPGVGGPGTQPSVAARSSFSTTQTIVQSFDVLFDGQVSATTFANWVASQGATAVEFHSYMMEHDILDTLGTAWNSYAGDERLWTKRQVMLDKINALHALGIKAILYGVPYAASPDFYVAHPAWAATDVAGYPDVFLPLPDAQWTGPTTNSCAPYLIFQALSRGANYPYVIDGTQYTNYRSYILAQFVNAVRDYGFDGVRVDFFGSPDNYYSASFAGASDESKDIVDFLQDLRTQLKAISSSKFVLMNEIPNTDHDIIRNGIVQQDATDAHWLELWPHTYETGPTYADSGLPDRLHPHTGWRQRRHSQLLPAIEQCGAVQCVREYAKRLAYPEPAI